MTAVIHETLLQEKLHFPQQPLTVDQLVTFYQSHHN